MALVDDALTQKLSHFYPLEREEIDALIRLRRPSRRMAAETEFIQERQSGQRAFILEEGWASAYKMLPQGGRQIINFAIPGDFMGLRSVLLRTADHSFAAVTPIVVSEIPTAELLDSFRAMPRLGAAVLCAASREEAIVVEHLVSLGRRTALQRTAHLLIELGLRLELVGLGSATAYAFPVNQYLLADALGLTSIHVNRVLRTLRERRLVTLRHGYVTIHDADSLAELAHYHGGYLNQNSRYNRHSPDEA